MYRTELPLRAHLASDPFIDNDITIVLLATTNANHINANIVDNTLVLPSQFCTKLQKWITSEKDVIRFFNGDDSQIEEFIKENEDNVETIREYLHLKISNDISNTQESRTQAWHLRKLITSIYSALHLVIFQENPAEISILGKRTLGIIVRLSPILSWDKKNHNSDFCDFANINSGYQITETDPIQEVNAMEDTFDFIEKALEKLLSFISRIEKISFGSLMGSSSLSRENIIRECTVIDKDVLKNWNRYGKYFSQKMDLANLPHFKLIDKIKSHESFVGANTKMIDILDNLFNIITDRKKDELLPIFIYSEPGLGKDNLSKICHLFSYKTDFNIIGKREIYDLFYGIQDDIYENHTQENRKSESKEILTNEGILTKMSKTIALNLNNSSKLHDKFEEGKTENSRWEIKYQEKDNENNISEGVKIIHNGFNYFAVNCGISFSESSFDRYIFGVKEINDIHTKAGAVLSAHLTHGTVFFDEFNTIKPEFATKFLRFLAHPYRFTIAGIAEEVATNILALFASNKTKEQLTEEVNITSAIINRISKHPFRIPPLRERREDIALYIVHWLLKTQGQNPIEKRIKRINIEALRLLCELEWKSNYRGLSGFMNMVLNERKRRRINSEEISFLEVLTSLKKLDYLKT